MLYQRRLNLMSTRRNVLHCNSKSDTSAQVGFPDDEVVGTSPEGHVEACATTDHWSIAPRDRRLESRVCCVTSARNRFSLTAFSSQGSQCAALAVHAQ